MSAVQTSRYSIVPAAGFDGPQGFDASLSMRNAVAVQIHGGTAVGGDDFPAIADAHRRVAGLDVGVLFRQPRDHIMGSALDDRAAEIPGDGLAAGVEDIPLRPSANDLG